MPVFHPGGRAAATGGPERRTAAAAGAARLGQVASRGCGQRLVRGVRRRSMRRGAECRDGVVRALGRDRGGVRRAPRSPARVPTAAHRPWCPAPHVAVASGARAVSDGCGAPSAWRESAQPCAVMPSTTSRSPPTEIPLRRRCVRFSGWSWGGSGTGAPWGLGRRTPGVIRVVQVCPWTGCSGWFSVCGCFTWNTSASVPASVSGLPLRQFRLCVCVSSASASASVSTSASVLLGLLVRRPAPLREPASGSAAGPAGGFPLRSYSRGPRRCLPVDRAGDR